MHGEGVADRHGLRLPLLRDARALHRDRTRSRVENHLRAVGLPTRISKIPGLDADAEAILAAMRQDKKVERGRLTFILAAGIGESFIAKDVAEADVLRFLKKELRAN